MLKIHLNNISTDNVCFYNDFWFDRKYNEGLIEITNKHIEIIKMIDNVSYDVKKQRITSKFVPNLDLDLTELSTGCKTALNILSFPEECFYIGGCGKNALEVIFSLDDGNAYIKDYMVPPLITKPISVDNIIISSYKDLLKTFDKSFRK